MASYNNLPTSSSNFADVNQLIRNLFEPMSGSSSLSPLGNRSTGLAKMLTTNWIPNVDVKHEASQYIVHADVPGVNIQNIEVNVTNGNTLTIKGKKETLAEKKGNNFVCLERTAGTFCRSITLPSAINASRIRAKVRNGVLEIIAPKLSGKSSSRKIKVKTEK